VRVKFVILAMVIAVTALLSGVYTAKACDFGANTGYFNGRWCYWDLPLGCDSFYRCMHDECWDYGDEYQYCGRCVDIGSCNEGCSSFNTCCSLGC
jgi:hypothetical protein